MNISDPKRMAGDFRRAVNVVRVRGWAQDNFEDDDGRVCALGALHHATELHHYNRVSGGNPYIEAARYLAEFLGVSHVPTWNDAYERTAEDVLGAFEQAAEKLEAEL